MSRPIQWYHSQAVLIWPDGTFQAQFSKICLTNALFILWRIFWQGLCPRWPTAVLRDLSSLSFATGRWEGDFFSIMMLGPGWARFNVSGFLTSQFCPFNGATFLTLGMRRKTLSLHLACTEFYSLHLVCAEWNFPYTCYAQNDTFNKLSMRSITISLQLVCAELHFSYTELHFANTWKRRMTLSLHLVYVERKTLSLHLVCAERHFAYTWMRRMTLSLNLVSAELQFPHNWYAQNYTLLTVGCAQWHFPGTWYAQNNNFPTIVMRRITLWLHLDAQNDTFLTLGSRRITISFQLVCAELHFP